MHQEQPQHREKRTATLAAAVSQSLKRQFDLAARVRGVTASALLEEITAKYIEHAVLPRATGIMPMMQDDPRVLSRLSDYIMESPEPTTVNQERVLWNDDNPALRFFRLCFLMPELLTVLERQTWEAIKSATVIEHEFTNGSGQRIRGWNDCDQAKCEAYIIKHWAEIEQACRGSIPTYALPVEREHRMSNAARK